MAQVPSLPSNGQPIDTQYIYDIVSSLISINGELATTGYSDVQASNVKTNNLRFQALSQNVVNSATVSKDAPTSGQVFFKTPFTQTPIATATLVSKTTSSQGATLTITGVDNSAVYYTVNYTTKGKTTLDINVIAIGV
jgi:hypothetical protein